MTDRSAKSIGEEWIGRERCSTASVIHEDRKPLFKFVSLPFRVVYRSHPSGRRSKLLISPLDSSATIRKIENVWNFSWQLPVN